MQLDIDTMTKHRRHTKSTFYLNFDIAVDSPLGHNFDQTSISPHYRVPAAWKEVMLFLFYENDKKNKVLNYFNLAMLEIFSIV